MNNKLSLAAAALLAASTIPSVNAAALVVVRITGSTAYRANVNFELNTNVFDQAPTLLNSSGAATTFSSSASAQIFSNTISGNPVVIKTSFSGSEAGIAALANVAVPNNVSGQPNANLPGTPTPSWPTASTIDSGPDTSVPDISLADTSQAVSLTQGGGVTDQGIVGVVQFAWMKSRNTGQSNWAHVVNITIPQINVLLSSGLKDITFLTGNSADFNSPNGANETKIVPIGRNKGSGTRVNTLIESLYGVTKTVNQYAYNPTYTAGVLNKPAVVTTLSDANVKNIGNDGYDSGGGVANILASTATTATTNIYVGYIGLGDANGVQALLNNNTGNAAAPTGPTSQYLTVNGVAYSDDAINNGAYDMWGHEHLLTSSVASSTALTVASRLKSDLINTALGGSSGLPYALNVSLFADRPSGGDTGFVTPL